MSRAYRVPAYEASATIEAEDHLCMELEMLDILPPGEMVSMLREELKAEGWKERADGAVESTVGEARAVLEAEGDKVTVERREHNRVNVRGYNKGEVNTRLEKAAERAKDTAQKNVVRSLLKVEPEVRETIQRALQRVYVRALKQKAKSMGEVESVREQRGETGELELTIKVKV